MIILVRICFFSFPWFFFLHFKFCVLQLILKNVWNCDFLWNLSWSTCSVIKLREFFTTIDIVIGLLLFLQQCLSFFLFENLKRIQRWSSCFDFDMIIRWNFTLLGACFEDIRLRWFSESIIREIWCDGSWSCLRGLRCYRFFSCCWYRRLLFFLHDFWSYLLLVFLENYCLLRKLTYWRLFCLNSRSSSLFVFREHHLLIKHNLFRWSLLSMLRTKMLANLTDVWVSRT